MTPAAVFDHLVVAAAALEQGEMYLEQRLGIRPQRGGKHDAMGTHNSLLKLDALSYIELIAVDPQATAPGRPRWFALDSSAMQSALRRGPRLIHWVARTTNMAGARRVFGQDPGQAQSMRRGPYAWQITVPPDGELPAGGVLPSLIEWREGRHPAAALPESGVRLLTLAAAHPEPALIRSTVAALALSDTITITYGTAPRLAAMLQTPRGPVTL